MGDENLAKIVLIIDHVFFIGRGAVHRGQLRGPLRDARARQGRDQGRKVKETSSNNYPFMFFRLPNYTYLNGLDFLITISAGMNGILVFHLRPLKTSLSGHE